MKLEVPSQTTSTKSATIRQKNRSERSQPLPKAVSIELGAGEQAEARRAIIAKRAYELYLLRGAQDGRDVEDWLQAEREL